MITAYELRERVNYDPETGSFTWKNGIVSGRGGVRFRAGSAVGGKTHDGYIKVKMSGRMYRAHRLAWLYVYGEWPTHQLDHINGVRSDNRIANLRHATSAENRRNAKVQANNATGLKGVCYIAKENRYQSRITISGKLKYLGSFKTPEEAHAAYCRAAEQHFGPFARAA